MSGGKVRGIGCGRELEARPAKEREGQAGREARKRREYAEATGNRGAGLSQRAESLGSSKNKRAGPVAAVRVSHTQQGSAHFRKESGFQRRAWQISGRLCAQYCD